GDLDVFGRLEALRVDALDRHEQFDQVMLDGRLSTERIQIRRVRWRWQGDAMRLDGEVRHPWVAGREVSLRLSGDIALATFARVAGSDQRIDGKIQVAIEGQWAKQTLRLHDVQARLGTGRLRGKVEGGPQGGAEGSGPPGARPPPASCSICARSSCPDP